MVLKIEPLDSRKHRRSSFCCGKDSLDNYLRKQATQDLKRKISTVFVLVDAQEDELETDILGYYSLSAFVVEVTDLDDAFAKSLPRYPLLPATLLGRLGIDRQQRGKRFGELLLIDALMKSFEVSNQIASLAVFAEALDEDAASFYLKYGFQRFKQDPMRLYLPMKLVEVLITN